MGPDFYCDLLKLSYNRTDQDFEIFFICVYCLHVKDINEQIVKVFMCENSLKS